MIWWWTQAALYLALAAGVTRLSWRYPAAVVGLTLVFCSTITTAAAWGGSFGTRVTLEVIQALVVVFSAKLAFEVARCVPSVLVVALELVDLAVCALVCLGPYPVLRANFDAETNAVFVLACLCVAYPGARDVVARPAARAARGLVGRRGAAANARRPGRP
jgi:hypothetical protein